MDGDFAREQVCQARRNEQVSMQAESTFDEPEELLTCCLKANISDLTLFAQSFSPHGYVLSTWQDHFQMCCMQPLHAHDLSWTMSHGAKT
jgi:hypothetical protein